MSGFPVIDLVGAPFDMGLAHGRTLAQEIRANFQTYVKMIRGYAGLGEDRIVELARLFTPVLREETPDLFTEMEGIARGAAVPLETILAINVRTELVFPDQLSAECTAIGLTGDRTASGGPILAQNWDWKPALKTGSAFFRLRPSQGPRALVFGEAGQVGKIGFNENGFGTLLNIVVASGVRPGLPIHVLLRRILGASDTAEARALVRAAQPGSSSHFLVGDRSGEIVGLEISPQEVAEIEPEDGAVVHTNHFCDPTLARSDLGRDLFPDSMLRLDRARSLVGGRQKWDAEHLRAVFVDHQGGPPSICRHTDSAAPEHTQTETVGSFIFELDPGIAHVTWGQPCHNEYYRVSL